MRKGDHTHHFIFTVARGKTGAGTSICCCCFSENKKTHKKGRGLRNTGVPNKWHLSPKPEEILEESSNTVRLKRVSEKSPIQGDISSFAAEPFRFSRGHHFWKPRLPFGSSMRSRRKRPLVVQENALPHVFVQKGGFCLASDRKLGFCRAPTSATKREHLACLSRGRGLLLPEQENSDWCGPCWEEWRSGSGLRTGPRGIAIQIASVHLVRRCD